MICLVEKTNIVDVLIIGGGPAGLAAAIALRQKGFDCTVVDALEPPINKVCGEGLMPDALHSLRALGIEIREEEGYRAYGRAQPCPQKRHSVSGSRFVVTMQSHPGATTLRCIGELAGNYILHRLRGTVFVSFSLHAKAG